MTSGADRDYSTLEVDREAESYAKILHQHESTLEAYTPEAQNDPSAPQVVDGDPPERYYEHGNGSGVQPRSRRICGYQRTAFYLVLTIIALVVIGAAIGGGVGASLSSNTSDDAEPTSTASASQPPGTLSPTTRLASINYTDESGIDYFLVYYQLSSNMICQSLWNNSKQSWTASVVSDDTDNIMASSPISADLWKHTSVLLPLPKLTTKFSVYPCLTSLLQNRDIHVYWLDPNNVIRGLSRSASGQWGDNGINDRYIAFGVTSYAKECSSCFNNNVVIYYGSDKTLEFVITKGTWQQKSFASSFPHPVNGSDIPLKPIYANNVSKYLVLHMNPAKGGNLTQIVYDGNAWAYNGTLTAHEAMRYFGHY